MKKISLIIINTLILFVLINIFIVFSWPIYSKFKSKKHNFTKEQIELLDLNEKDLVTFFNETKYYSKLQFQPFIGHTETERSGKFINFNNENGRKVNRPQNCNKNIYMYGGSTTFGYNVTDDQTIASYLQNYLNDDFCVYNHGRVYFYSKQENNLLSLHLENRKKIDYAIFLDGINERCGGYEFARKLSSSFNFFIQRPYLMWKKASINFLISLPITQFYNSIRNKGRWINDPDNNILIIDSCKNKIPLDLLFQERVNQRHAICNTSNIKCFSFIQPMAGSHGKQIKKFLNDERKKYFVIKYETLKKAKDTVIDLGYVLDDDNNLSYIDAAHYSPATNEKIAIELVKYLENKM